MSDNTMNCSSSVDTAPHLPVGGANKYALPDSNRRKEYHARTVNRSAAPFSEAE